MIHVQNLTKIYRSPKKSGIFLKDLFNRTYEENKALKNISFAIGEGELVGFIGPNGAGKTTTMKILAGILYPTSGKVDVLGYKPFDKKIPFLKDIAFVMGQKNQLLWELPPTDSFTLNKEIYEVSDEEYKKTITELIDLLEAKEFLDRPVKTLSLGQRMRAELIAALVHSPKVLFLDEPTIGLDIFAQTTIVNFIREYQKRFKATIMLTSHYMQDVQRLAKRVIMIDHGSIVFDGKLDTLVAKYSAQKIVRVVVTKQLTLNEMQLPTYVKVEYHHPQLSLTIPKDKVEDVIQNILSKIDYVDVTIENEPIEDIVKKKFEE
ncbi:ATP-binding cassette domain-containing protein [Candidatus Woesebacteria bacterium]|nr:ATP-binding cassette domain-containing protein [Candidatus Woesebacteria bacterium]